MDPYPRYEPYPQASAVNQDAYRETMGGARRSIPSIKPAKVRWWVVPVVAVPLGVFLFFFLLVFAFIFFVTIPLVLIAMTIAVTVCFVMSKSSPNAQVVGVGLMLSLLVCALMISGLFVWSGAR